MEFPSMEFVKGVQEKLNADSAFHRATKWSDVKVLLCLGENRYWIKLYGGKIIDAMEYLPLSNPLGWDYMISASLETWEDLRKERKALGELVNFGHIAMDGNLLEANRMHEGNYLILEAVRDIG